MHYRIPINNICWHDRASSDPAIRAIGSSLVIEDLVAEIDENLASMFAHGVLIQFTREHR